ncbi:hypothetical protein FGG08_004086 [Glutinoglossum americanum]|uniref:Transcription factor IIIC 90kDa subunit N-terminal domain-containing protein n=1 Tax=Glutinoglossum americanum TaxID=1670608 RepID=A0A9P8L494_9PEZI|nr:hypothetical protein FGG08_004086 [Glutinoglossum americanum]
MLQDIKLPFFPSIQECVVWSSDGDIAIAAGDSIQIMSPRPIYKALRAGSASYVIQTDNGGQWELSRFKTNDFPAAGALEFNHAGFDIFSIGEEQSAALISGIAWSPPGIARYRRCILAVLSTTHILSLFEPPSSSPLFGGWRRALIVNTTVKGYLRAQENAEKGSEDDKSKLRRLRGRIRAFSWSYESYFGDASLCQDKDGDFSRATGEFFLALANENNEIIFVQICSPCGHIPAEARGEWSARIVGRIQAHPGDDVGVKFSSSLPNRPDRFISKLSWSPWYRTKYGQNEAFIAYSTRGKLKIRKVSVTMSERQSTRRTDQEDFGFQIGDRDWEVASAFSERYHFGPLVWYEKAWNGRLILVFATPGSIRVASIPQEPENHSSIDEPSNKAVIVREYPNKYWDCVTGMILRTDPNNSEVLTIHVATQLSHTFVLRYSFPESSAPEARPNCLPAENSENWARAIAYHRANFGSRHNLGGLASAKTWGLARSPMGGCIAACITLHPSGMIEYATHNSESCRIVFGMEQEVLEQLFQIRESDRVKPGILSLSIEAFVQDARHLEEPSGLGVTRSAQRPAIRPLEQLWKRLRSSLLTGSDSQKIDVNMVTYPQTDSPLTMESAISQNIIYNPMLTTSRYQHVISNIHRYQDVVNDAITQNRLPATSQRSSSSDDIPVEIIFQLITSILLIPHKWVRGSRLSKRILYAAACVGALGLYEVKRILELSEQTFRWLAVTENVDLGLELEHCRRRAEAAAAGPFLAGDMRVISFPAREKDQLQTPGAKVIFETCEICGGSIGWRDVRTARCANSHVFAIQRPGISKYCGVCGKEYLSEGINQLERLSTPDESGENDQNGKSNTGGLAQVLLEAAMEVDAEANPLPTEGERAPDTPIQEESPNGDDIQPSLASLLLAACDKKPLVHNPSPIQLLSRRFRPLISSSRKTIPGYPVSKMHQHNEGGANHPNFQKRLANINALKQDLVTTLKDVDQLFSNPGYPRNSNAGNTIIHTPAFKHPTLEEGISAEDEGQVTSTNGEPAAQETPSSQPGYEVLVDDQQPMGLRETQGEGEDEGCLGRRQAVSPRMDVISQEPKVVELVGGKSLWPDNETLVQSILRGLGKRDPSVIPEGLWAQTPDEKIAKTNRTSDHPSLLCQRISTVMEIRARIASHADHTVLLIKSHLQREAHDTVGVQKSGHHIDTSACSLADISAVMKALALTIEGMRAEGELRKFIMAAQGCYS